VCLFCFYDSSQALRQCQHFPYVSSVTVPSRKPQRQELWLSPGHRPGLFCSERLGQLPEITQLESGRAGDDIGVFRTIEPKFFLIFLGDDTSWPVSLPPCLQAGPWV
jgi:hypothetical protein